MSAERFGRDGAGSNRFRAVSHLVVGALLVASIMLEVVSSGLVNKQTINYKVSNGFAKTSSFIKTMFASESSAQATVRRLRRTKSMSDDDSAENAISLDFFIAGFAKTGTTSLLTAFRLHNETVTPKREVCVMTNPGTDEEIYDKMMNEIEPLAPGNANVKRGIKCPQGLASLLSIERLSRMFPDTKLVYGLRHPVMQFQSFYNYRVLSLYESGRRQDEQIPSAETLIEESWKLVSTKHTRFEETLKNLGKTNTTENLPSTPFKVFLYTIEQMHDSSEDRRLAFRNALGSFLGLEKSIPALPNSNHQSKSYDETIDICDSKYDEVRRVLVKNGKETQRWILEDFIHSPDVTVANKGHFHELLESFGIDPCLQSVE